MDLPYRESNGVSGFFFAGVRQVLFPPAKDLLFLDLPVRGIIVALLAKSRYESDVADGRLQIPGWWFQTKHALASLEKI